MLSILGFRQVDNDLNPSWNIVHYSFTSLKFLCALPIHAFLLATHKKPVLLFCILWLTFPECHIVGRIHCVTIQIWLHYLSNVHPRYRSSPGLTYFCFPVIPLPGYHSLFIPFVVYEQAYCLLPILGNSDISAMNICVQIFEGQSLYFLILLNLQQLPFLIFTIINSCFISPLFLLSFYQKFTKFISFYE